MSESRPANRRYWIVVQRASSRIEALTVVRDSPGAVLPVFSFEEEAELFLRCETREDGWRVRETTPGELASVLYGPCSGVRTVALDPLPELLGEGMMDLVSLERKVFLKTLLKRTRPRGPAPGLRPEKSRYRVESALRG